MRDDGAVVNGQFCGTKAVVTYLIHHANGCWTETYKTYGNISYNISVGI
jgi:hypothetical protein